MRQQIAVKLGAIFRRFTQQRSELFLTTASDQAPWHAYYY